MLFELSISLITGEGKGFSSFINISEHFFWMNFAFSCFSFGPQLSLHSRLFSPDSEPGAPAALTGLGGHTRRVLSQGRFEGPALNTAWWWEE